MVALRLPIASRSFAGDGRGSSPTASVIGGAAPPPRRAPLDTVIFLDVDGVLHSLYGDDLFKESCMALFERIVRATDASIVLSSSWRVEAGKVAILNSVLQKRKLPIACDCTRDLNMPREVEICEWLDRHPGVVRWIVIDDMDLQCKPTPQAQRLQGHFVRTRSGEGLTQQDAELAIRLLVTQSFAPAMSASPRSCPANVARTLSTGMLSPTDRGLELNVGPPTPLRNQLRACRTSPVHKSPRCDLARRTRRHCTMAAALSCEALPVCRGTPCLESRDMEMASPVSVSARGSLSFVPEASPVSVSTMGSFSFVPEATPASASTVGSLSFTPEVRRRTQHLRTCPVLRAPLAGDISPQVQCRQIRARPACGQEVVRSS